MQTNGVAEGPGKNNNPCSGKPVHNDLDGEEFCAEGASRKHENYIKSGALCLLIT